MANQLPLILVADDDKDFRGIIVDALTSKGFQIKTASNGDEAVKMAKEFHPPLILMDVQMPGKDGITAMSELKQNPHTKDIKVLFLSNLGDASWAATTEINRKLAQQLGATDYFKKGGNLDVLVDHIRQHLYS